MSRRTDLELPEMETNQPAPFFQDGTGIARAVVDGVLYFEFRGFGLQDAGPNAAAYRPKQTVKLRYLGEPGKPDFAFEVLPK